MSATTFCLFYHPKTEEERKELVQRIKQARQADPFTAAHMLQCVMKCQCGWSPDQIKKETE